MIVGAYSLHLYCDKEDNHGGMGEFGYYFKQDTAEWIEVYNEYVGETYGECVKQARKDGWLVNRRKNKCLCKYCK